MRITLVALSLLVFGASASSADERATVECAFQHARYVGTCVEKVTPEKDQSHLAACRVVLACLNDPRCVKTYCQATTIRGGWTLVSPKPESNEGEQRGRSVG